MGTRTGGPLGFGIIDDIGGHDHYYLGGLYVNSYKPETPGYEAFGQGVGGGIRQVACGGIGMLLNGGGHNVYEFDYLAHGGGYWCGLGFARDFGGYSKRLIARKNYYGGERTESLFQTVGVGWGCHYALGFCFDDKGHSTFEGSIMGSGMGWDCSVGAAVFGGNNHFDADQSLVQGNGSQGSLGILYQYGDDSEFKGWGQGYASANLTYHNPYDCGGNFSFMVSYGNGNNYGCGHAEHAIIQQRDLRRVPRQPSPPRSGHAHRQPAQRENDRRSGEVAAYNSRRLLDVGHIPLCLPRPPDGRSFACLRRSGPGGRHHYYRCDQASAGVQRRCVQGSDGDKSTAPAPVDASPTPPRRTTRSSSTSRRKWPSARDRVRRLLTALRQQPFNTQQNDCADVLEFCRGLG